MPALDSSSLSVDAVNALDAADFTARFGDVAEHSPWVAERAAAARSFADREAVVAAFVAAVRDAPPESQLALIRAHPDLAERAAVAEDTGSGGEGRAGGIATESRREQAGAGLDRLTPDEFARFAELNARYRERFGFPFIFAVKGANKEMILAAFEERIENDTATERATALANVERILRFRIEDRIAP